MEITVNVPPRPLKGFLRLPREVRDMVYIYALVQPIKWKRRHQLDCQLCPRTCDTFEQALCTYGTAQPCGCIKRTGLNLLLANRQIHQEAAPIFWSKNAHCFTQSSVVYHGAPQPELIRDVGQTLRPEYRLLLRHLSVTIDRWTLLAMPINPISMSPAQREKALGVWQVILQCAGLQRLEIHPCFAVPGWQEAEPYSQLVDTHTILPNLKSFSWQIATLVQVEENTTEEDWSGFPVRYPLPCLTTLPVCLDTLNTYQAVRQAMRDFETNFLVHLNYAVETQLLGLSDEQALLPFSRLKEHSYRLRGGLNDRNKSIVLHLRDKTDITVELLGLPISPETRKQQGRQRYLNDILLKRQGKPTAREQRWAKVVAIQQAANKEKLRNQEDDKHRRELATKKAKKLEETARRQEQEEKEKEEEKRRSEDTRKALVDARKRERKRIP